MKKWEQILLAVAIVVGGLLGQSKAKSVMACEPCNVCSSTRHCSGCSCVVDVPPAPPPANEDPWTCFPAGTKVSMASTGGTKNIEDVKVGDQVVSQDESGNRSVSTVAKLDQPVRDHMCQINFDNGEHLQLTNEHPLMTQDGWKSIAPDKTAEENPNLIVGSIVQGDVITREDGVRAQVKDISCWSERTQAYNLILDNGAHTYFANGYLAHNKTDCWIGAINCPDGQVRTSTLIKKDCVNFKGACIGTAQIMGTNQCSGTTTKFLYTYSCCNTGAFSTSPSLQNPLDGEQIGGITAQLQWQPLTEEEWGADCDGLTRTYDVFLKKSTDAAYTLIASVDSSENIYYFTGVKNTTYNWYIRARKGELGKNGYSVSSAYYTTSSVFSFSFVDVQVNGTVYYDPNPGTCSTSTPISDVESGSMTVNSPSTCPATLAGLQSRGIAGPYTVLTNILSKTLGAYNASYPPGKAAYPLLADFFADSSGQKYYIAKRYITPVPYSYKTKPYSYYGETGTIWTKIAHAFNYPNMYDPEIDVTITDQEKEDCLNAPHIENANVEVGTGGGPGKYTIDNLGPATGAYTFTLSNIPAGYQCKPGCGACPVRTGVSSPSAYVNFFLTKKDDFVPWWQAEGSGIYAGGNVQSNLADSSMRLILGSATGSTVGALITGAGSPQLGGGKVSDEGWMATSTYKGKKMDYAYFAANMGVVKGQLSEWQSDTIDLPAADASKDFWYSKPVSGTAKIEAPWTVGSGEKYVIFVNGNLQIDANITVANGGFLAFVVNGKVSVGTETTSVQGMYISSGNFVSQSKFDKDADIVDNPLEIDGTVAAWGDVQLLRNLGLGNSVPAEKFVYRPDLLTNMPEKMKTFAMQWQEVSAGTIGN